MDTEELNALRDRAYKTAVEHGFHKDVMPDAYYLGLVMSEAGDAIYPNQYVGGLSPTQKARRWKSKKWFKVRHIEDISDPRSRLIPIYRG